MIQEIADVVKARVLWAVIPCKAALGVDDDGLAAIVSWAADNVREDVRKIVNRHSGSAL